MAINKNRAYEGTENRLNFGHSIHFSFSPIPNNPKNFTQKSIQANVNLLTDWCEKRSTNLKDEKEFWMFQNKTL
jgi:hypothetical protein